MSAELNEHEPARLLTIGQTPQVYVLEAEPPFTEDEVRAMQWPATAEPVSQTEFPDGQLDIDFPRDAFEGTQDVLGFARSVAKSIGNCAVSPRIRQIMDARYSVQSH